MIPQIRTIGDPNAGRRVFLLIGHREESFAETVFRGVQKRNGKDFSLVCVKIADWNHDLSPWEAPPVFGEEGFGDGAEEMLQSLLRWIDAENAVHGEKKNYLAGYSLGGLFALWSGTRTDLFTGVAGVSPSVWFPNWDNYTGENPVKAGRVYLSLGDKEAKTRNPVMATVADRITAQHQLLVQQGIETILEWNSGNHFVDSEVRTAKGIAWLLRKL